MQYHHPGRPGHARAGPGGPTAQVHQRDRRDHPPLEAVRPGNQGPACHDPIQASQNWPVRLALTFGQRLYVGYGPAFPAEARVFGCPDPIPGALYAAVNSPLAKAMEANADLTVEVVPGTDADKLAGAFVTTGPGLRRHWKVVSFEPAR